MATTRRASSTRQSAAGNGLGYSAVLIVVAFVRELIGQGTLFGATVMPAVEDGGWYQPLGVLLLAPSAFFILGFLIWAIRSLRPGQIEPDDYPVAEEPGR